MIELKGFKKYIYEFLKRIGIIEEKQISKKDMCKSAINSNICHKDCNTCAWSDEL